MTQPVQSKNKFNSRTTHNSVTLHGYLVSTPVPDQTPSRVEISRFQVGTQNLTGPDVILNVVLFGPTAARINKFSKRGGMILVQGYLRPTRDGGFEVVGDNAFMMAGRYQGNMPDDPAAGSNASLDGKLLGGQSLDDDDIPF